MKKAYFCPNTEVMTLLSTHQLMAGSAKGTTIIDDDTTPADNTKDVLTRRNRTVWDDEEEEMEENF